jgi:hypothetical protein
MELRRQPEKGPQDVPASELWGRRVYDTQRLLIGTIDSITQTLGGSKRAIVQTSRRPRHFVFVELQDAVFEGEAVVVPAPSRQPSGAEGSPSVGMTWSAGARRHG